jgi:amidophosphoribosyltransferase
LKKPKDEMRNAVKAIYAPFTDEEISAKIAADDLAPRKRPGTAGSGHLPDHPRPSLRLGAEYGDWYFSGDYPTPGGYTVVNQLLHPLLRRQKWPRPRGAAVSGVTFLGLTQ